MNSIRTTTAATLRQNLTPLLCAAALLCAGTAFGQKDDKPRPAKFSIAPIKSRPYGKSYGQWGAEWWKWALSFPADQNPIRDTTGEFGSQGQDGPVWFLAGTGGGAVERTITIPAGKGIFFPLNNVINDYPCPDPNFQPAPGQTLEEFLAEGAAFFVDHATELSLEVDGMPAKNLFNYRAASSLFTFTGHPSLTVFDPCITGEPQPAVSDGYWVMLRPLTPGKHTIHFASKAEFPEFGFDFSVDVTYHLKVVRPARIFPPQSHPYGRSYAQWSAKFWKTGIELPAAGNPYVEGGCGELSDRVMFLAGPIGSTEISCTIPAGTALFVPALTVECSSLEPPESGFHGDTAEEQAECATWWSDHIVNPSVEINGLPVPDIARYRVVSPQFEFTAPDPNILGVAGGGAGTAVADGYYLMVAPLPRGKHTIRIRGSLRFSVADGDPFDLDLTADNLFHITVE